jgi:phosphate transport system protein
MTLSHHTVKSYDKDLQSVAQTIEEMSHLVLVSIDMIADAIKNHDSTLVESIKAHDYKINSLDLLVEKKVTSMLALRQPMAVDLRYIVSSIKVSSNLERIGDQAKSIVKKTEMIAKFDNAAKDSLLKMLDLSKTMVIDSVKSFNEQNSEVAENVLKSDDQIDNIYRGLFGIINHEKFTHDEVENIVNILFIAKSFERLADHTTNIAEITQYVITGESK